MINIFTIGQAVTCINDQFHPSICEWGDQLPRKGGVYTVKAVCQVADNLSGVVGTGLLLAELSNPSDRLYFSEWRFEPFVFWAVENKIMVETLCHP